MNWFKIEVDKGKEGTYHYVGSTADALETLIEKAQRGEFLRLADLLYVDRGDLKTWDEWDRSLMPSVAINPRTVISIMQFKGDPRTTSRR